MIVKHRKMPALVWCAWVLVFLGASGAFAAELTFEQALEMLHEHNESLKAARTDLEMSEQRRLEARGLYFPEVSLGGNYTVLDDAVSIDLDALRQVIVSLHPAVPAGAVPAFDLPVQDERYWQAHIGFTWPVFAGGRILAANRASDAMLEASRQTVRATEYGLVSRLVQRYFGVRLARKVVEVRLQLLRGMERHLARAGALEKEGMISRAERLHAEVARAEAERLHSSALREAEIAETVLGSILSAEEPRNPVSPLFTVNDLEPVEYFRKQALLNSPLLKRLAARKEAAHQGYRKELGTLMPEVYLFGRRQLRDDDLTVLDPEWAAGVGVNMTLFEGMRRKHRIESARLQERKLAHLEKRLERDLTALVDKCYQEFMMARERLQSLAASFEAAEENLRVRTKAFEEGYGTSLDVVDAELALSRARIERLTAVYRMDVSLAALLEAGGRSERFVEYQKNSRAEVMS